MNDFLRSARNDFEANENITIVIGNESCDLDSAVCAVTLAQFYSHVSNASIKYVPILNITKENLPLKTEVVHMFRKNGVEVDLLVCIDELKPNHVSAKYILVDHHVSNCINIPENIVEIVDHRPLDPNAKFPDRCRVTLQEVGSCATLIAQLVLTSSVNIQIEHRKEILALLHAAIILDTVNFSPSADKSRELDVSIANQIEDIIEFDVKSRKHLFNELIKARSDISSLTPLQLLSKDLKIILNPSKSIVIAIPGFPILVEDYVKKENASNAILTFGKNKNCQLIILMGLTETETGEIRRDIGIISLKESQFNNLINEKLLSRDEIALDLSTKQISLAGLPMAKFYEQRNIRASRKQILPVIQRFLNHS